MPVFNEKNTILEVITRVKYTEVPDLEKEMIVVDDGSTDGTKEILSGLSDPSIKIILHEKNRGKGAAIRTGISVAAGDYIIIQDADMEYDPHDYRKMLKPIIDGKAQVVYGSRFTGERRDMLFWHMLGNKLLSLVTNVLYNTTISDMETGYKLFTRESLEGITLRSNRFEIEPELTAKFCRKGLRIYEVPVSYTGREKREGKKISWRDGIIALWTLFKYRFIS
jgi:glycosyltransferase involved in cell wall biosynthesis